MSVFEAGSALRRFPGASAELAALQPPTQAEHGHPAAAAHADGEAGAGFYTYVTEAQEHDEAEPAPSAHGEGASLFAEPPPAGLQLPTRPRTSRGMGSPSARTFLNGAAHAGTASLRDQFAALELVPLLRLNGEDLFDPSALPEVHLHGDDLRLAWLENLPFAPRGAPGCGGPEVAFFRPNAALLARAVEKGLAGFLRGDVRTCSLAASATSGPLQAAETFWSHEAAYSGLHQLRRLASAGLRQNRREQLGVHLGHASVHRHTRAQDGSALPLAWLLRLLSDGDPRWHSDLLLLTTRQANAVVRRALSEAQGVLCSAGEQEVALFDAEPRDVFFYLEDADQVSLGCRDSICVQLGWSYDQLTQLPHAFQEGVQVPAQGPSFVGVRLLLDRPGQTPTQNHSRVQLSDLWLVSDASRT